MRTLITETPKKRTCRLNQNSILPHIKRHATKFLPEEMKTLQDEGWCLGIGERIAFSLVADKDTPFYSKFDNLLDALETAYQSEIDLGLQTIISDIVTRHLKRGKNYILIGKGLFKPDAFSQICQKRLISPGFCIAIDIVPDEDSVDISDISSHIIYISKTPHDYAIIDANLITLLIEKEKVSDIDEYIETKTKNLFLNRPVVQYISWVILNPEELELKLIDDDIQNHYLLPKLNPSEISQVVQSYPWIKTHFSLSFRDLRNASFENLTLENIPIKDSNLTNVQLKGKNLCGTNLEKSILINVNFENVIMDAKTNFSWVKVYNAQNLAFCNAWPTIIKADFSSVKVIFGILYTICRYFSQRKISTSRSCYSHAGQYLFEKMMTEESKKSSTLFDSFMENGYVDVTSTRSTYRLKDDGFRHFFDSRDSRYKKVPENYYDYRGQDLSGLSFVECTLCGADFKGAILYGTNFACANLAGADFRGALIDEKTNFNRANLMGAKIGPLRNREIWKNLMKATLSNDQEKDALLKILCGYLSDRVYSYSCRLMEKNKDRGIVEKLFGILMENGDIENFLKTRQIKGLESLWISNKELQLLIIKWKETKQEQSKSMLM